MHRQRHFLVKTSLGQNRLFQFAERGDEPLTVFELKTLCEETLAVGHRVVDMVEIPEWAWQAMRDDTLYSQSGYRLRRRGDVVPLNAFR